MKIGILYICTGKYTVFWKDFYSSCERNFIPEAEIHYFVFTDAPEIDFERENPRIHRIYQADLGWPGNTLKRFSVFLKSRDQLQKMDYIFFCNANLLVLEKITPDEFLPKGQEKLVACMHPGFSNKTPDKFSYDRNPLSKAYIPMGKGKYYFAGGLNGGKTKDFLEAAKEMDLRTSEDDKNGIIALWHDESHWNNFLLSINYADLKILGPSYLYPENSSFPFKPKILIRSKSNYLNLNRVRGARMTLKHIKQINHIMKKLNKS